MLNFEYIVAGIVNSIAWPKCLWSNGAPSRSHLDRAIKFKALFRCDDGHNAKLCHRGEAVVQADFLNDFAVDNLENCRTSEAQEPQRRRRSKVDRLPQVGQVLPAVGDRPSA